MKYAYSVLYMFNGKSMRQVMKGSKKAIMQDAKENGVVILAMVKL